MAPLDRANVDTDQIIPKQFLKRIERSGFGPFLFYDWRREPDFVLDRPEYQGAPILVAGPNFGCGSSREHAPWALQDAGYRAVIASSFADIFKTNCLKIGLVPVELPEGKVRQLLDLAAEDPSFQINIDLETQCVVADGFSESFTLPEFNRQCLLNGWDEIAITLLHEADISRYESQAEASRPRSA
jgi:3-isopropylmalate/(R)-2-methylmalate dehydratase small subunit